MSATDPLKDKYNSSSSSISTGKIHKRSLSYNRPIQDELLAELQEKTLSPDISLAISAHLDLADWALRSHRSARHHIDAAFVLYSRLEEPDLRAQYLVRLSELAGQHYLREKKTQSLKLRSHLPERIAMRSYKETDASIALSFHMDLAERALNKNIKQASEEVAQYHIEKAWRFYDFISDLELRQEYRIKFSKLYIKLYKRENKSNLLEKTYLQLIEETESDNIAVAISAHIKLADRILKNDQEEYYQSAQYHIEKAIDICCCYVINSDQQKEYMDKLHLLLMELLKKSENKYDIVDWNLSIYMRYLEKAIDTDLNNTNIYIRQAMCLLSCAGEYEGKQDHVSRLEYFMTRNHEQLRLKMTIDSCLQKAHNSIRDANNSAELKVAFPYIKQAEQLCKEVDSEVRRSNYNKELAKLHTDFKRKKAEFARQQSKITMPPSVSTNKMGQFSHASKEGRGNEGEEKSRSFSEFLFRHKK